LAVSAARITSEQGGRPDLRQESQPVSGPWLVCRAIRKPRANPRILETFAIVAPSWTINTYADERLFWRPTSEKLAVFTKAIRHCSVTSAAIIFAQESPTKSNQESQTQMPLLNVKLIEGVFSDAQKQEMIRKLTHTMVSIEGENMRGVTWVVIEEVKSGDWGIGGNPLTTGDVKALADGKK
jgi:4-oxalocrotonate tautomerase